MRNSFPVQLRMAPFLSVFKSLLKTHLFSLAFNMCSFVDFHFKLCVPMLYRVAYFILDFILDLLFSLYTALWSASRLFWKSFKNNLNLLI